jgi:single-strand DNA-binding protein
VSVNRVTLIGRLGNDPEVRSTATSQRVATLRVATNARWIDKNGQRQEATEWHRVVLWAKLATLAETYLAKGREIYVEGRLQTREWQDQTGQKRYTTEIIATNLQLLGAKPEEVSASEGTQAESVVPSELDQVAEQLEGGGWEPAAHPQGGPGQPVQAQ